MGKRKERKPYTCRIINPERIPYACQQYERAINEIVLKINKSEKAEEC